MLKYLTKLDPDRDTSDNWKVADTLDFGWFAYAPVELRERYRDAGSNEALSRCLKFDMRRWVRQGIEDEEIVAFGIQVAPDPKSEPERISPVFFQSTEVTIDWEKGRISGLGREYHDVRICLCLEQRIDPRQPIAPITQNTKRGGGRPSQYPKAKIVLEFLFRDASCLEMSSSELLEPFHEEFKKRFAGQRKIAPISERSLRNYLTKFRKELAETGNN